MLCVGLILVRVLNSKPRRTHINQWCCTLEPEACGNGKDGSYAPKKGRCPKADGIQRSESARFLQPPGAEILNDEHSTQDCVCRSKTSGIAAVESGFRVSSHCGSGKDLQ